LISLSIEWVRIKERQIPMIIKYNLFIKVDKNVKISLVFFLENLIDKFKN